MPLGSREFSVEVLVVADYSLWKVHRENTEHFLLTIMNIVQALYQDPTIGNHITVVTNRLVIVNQPIDELRTSTYAAAAINNFCHWQNINNGGTYGNVTILPHDNAILITGTNLCNDVNDSQCDTLGIAPVNGMCDPQRSCNMAQDIGIQTAFTACL